MKAVFDSAYDVFESVEIRGGAGEGQQVDAQEPRAVVFDEDVQAELVGQEEAAAQAAAGGRRVAAHDHGVAAG
ncbi:hypothetical protein GCM10017673_38990 [Streptosporangium violaceochromogenes]|nr:hypothetical protein GCM10017673_38990 [Streptosporangium violaceochromogenes]